MRRSSRLIPLWPLLLLALPWATGCQVVSNLPAPGRVFTLREPAYGREYHLYVPSYYAEQPARRWPLVVVCHGTRPFDTARLQLKAWKGLAEREGFLVAAPELIGTSGGIRRDPADQIRRQIEDEKAILSIVRAISAARRIDETRVFLTCWSAGAYAVLFTGLRHPDIFRALSLYQGNFDPAYVEPCIPFLDPHQPIQIVHGRLDPIADAQACIDWLRAHDFEPVIVERPGSHRRDPEVVFDFFSEVVRKHPWIRVHVRDDPSDPMTARFRVKTSFEPVGFRWDFGDGTGSAEPAPEHRYDQPGTYLVRVAVWSAKNRYDVRRVKLQVPRIRLGTTPTPTTTAPAS